MSSVSQPDISVCIANYNGGELVLECLDSAFAQQGGFRIEVLVHDDASSDGSPERIRARFPNARVIASEANCGFCISNNRMAAAASGRYLLLLNNDAVLRPGSLQRLLRFAEEGHQDCILGLPQYAMADGALVDRGYRTDPFLNPIPMLDPQTHEVGVATGACLWIPRQTWDEVGGFPPWFESVAEDIFLCLAARLLGHRVFVLDGPGFDHWVGKQLGGGKLVDGGLQTTVRRRALSERNKTLTMLCCYPWPALACILPIHALLLAIEACALLVSGAGAATVLAIYAPLPRQLWARRRQARALRRSLRQRRTAPPATLFAFTRWIPQKLAMLLRHGFPAIGN
ncbi:glycosyltransferase [Luteimonas sp. 50]|uniref:Glycosyltransferase n=1 Tax=Cognatiluteimonas sedimenti TaxID=2927791 RepID=A0ABT0A417_9GAMM|nr:glycosyltransferase [Lysobacter sedimenti]MCJ0825711.1 glycosyltransferase [Lysobacter sedimenti]